MVRWSLRILAAAFMVAASAQAFSQTLDEIDTLSDRSAAEQSGIDLAREQTDRGEVLEALATIERVLTLFPNSATARLEHARLLCRMGDPQGAQIEFRKLKSKHYPAKTLSQAIASCQTTPAGGEP